MHNKFTPIVPKFRKDFKKTNQSHRRVTRNVNLVDAVVIKNKKNEVDMNHEHLLKVNRISDKIRDYQKMTALIQCLQVYPLRVGVFGDPRMYITIQSKEHAAKMIEVLKEIQTEYGEEIDNFRIDPENDDEEVIIIRKKRS